MNIWSKAYLTYLIDLVDLVHKQKYRKSFYLNLDPLGSWSPVSNISCLFCSINNLIYKKSRIERKEEIRMHCVCRKKLFFPTFMHSSAPFPPFFGYFLKFILWIYKNIGNPFYSYTFVNPYLSFFYHIFSFRIFCFKKFIVTTNRT